MLEKKFELISPHGPAGDQPKAIEALVKGLYRGDKYQTLLGVTGSGKTFTAANVIALTQKPALVIAHNKTLAAQLCNEFRELFPKNSVNYFVSYYDYYQPEAYIPRTDTYIGKEAMINEEIDKLRHAATTALLTRKDVIVVASVSCIYGLGAPAVYAQNIFHLKIGDKIDRKEFTARLVNLQFTRTTADLKRGTFRLRGETWEIMPPDREVIYHFFLNNGEIKEIYEVDPVEGFVPGKTEKLGEIFIAPAKHFITEAPDRERALKLIQRELEDRLKELEAEGKLLEAERLEHRAKQDMAMIREIGYCGGIENYSRHLSGREAGEAPDTLLSYFPKDFLTIIDESHVTIPQLGGMYEGDRSRKKTLIEFGFRLPSAIDNRPLKFKEFEDRLSQVICTSATPGDFELKKSSRIVEQIIRPTGLVDPDVVISPARGQVEDLKQRIEQRVNPPDGKDKARVLVTTLTKKMAEDLAEYLKEKKYKVTYLHSDVKPLDRIRILTNFRKGEFDVLVGVNLLREGLDLPEVSLVAILDADKEGFLRSETSLIQTIGRAARNVDGQVILYADHNTGSIERAVAETNRRRTLQLEYNKKHNITPQTIKKAIKDITAMLEKADQKAGQTLKIELGAAGLTSLEKVLREKEREMRQAAKELDFELAALLRDEIKSIRIQLTARKERSSQVKSK